MKRVLSILAFGLYAHHALPINMAKFKKAESYHHKMNVDSLKSMYGHNKEIPKEYERTVLIALSHYPELKDTRITFKKTHINTTLNVRPSISSLLFHSKANREYVIRINDILQDSTINIKDVPFEAQIGLFGHEFSHILDYNSRDVWGMISRLFSYLDKKQKVMYEKQTDRLTIKHGLGKQLHQWSDYVLNKSDAHEEYKLYKKEHYLQPHEINELLEKANNL